MFTLQEIEGGGLILIWLVGKLVIGFLSSAASSLFWKGLEGLSVCVISFDTFASSLIVFFVTIVDYLLLESENGISLAKVIESSVWVLAETPIVDGISSIVWVCFVSVYPWSASY